MSIKPYPVIFEPTAEGYSGFFPDFPGAITAGFDYEDTMCHAEQCLSLHIYGMLRDGEALPKPTHMSDILAQLDKGEIATLVHADVFAIMAKQEDKAMRVNITFPKSLLEAVDQRARQLGLDRSKLLQQAAKACLALHGEANA